MFQNEIRPDQVTQVRGFPDQRLRKKDAPLDPANRRISLIVQHQEKKPPAEAEGGEAGREGKAAEGKHEGGGEAKPAGEAKMTEAPQKE